MVNADCSPGFYFYPKSQLVHKNTKIIIEAYDYFDNSHTSILKGLDDKYPIYLVSENRKIRLIKERYVEGELNLHQAIFKLDEFLVFGEKYEIEVLNLKDRKKDDFDHTLMKIRNGKYEKINWIARNEIDNQIPKISKNVKFSETELIYYGCGPLVMSNFVFQATDNSELLVLTELVDTGSKVSQKYFVIATENKISIGKRMCEGAFKFEKEKEYKVRFKFYDLNGNTDDKWTDWIKCENPLNKEK